MEACFQRGEEPWKEICSRCVFFRPNEPFDNRLAARHLERIHVEPSLACALRCPGCSRVSQAKQRKGPVFLSVSVFRRLLSSLRAEGYRTDMFYFCGQGEPLSNPAIEDLIAACREFFPNTQLVINTNGNYVFSEVFKRGIYPDKLIVSVDGLHQESYEKYRINGDVETTLRFMYDAKQVPAGGPAIEWKYILFTYNDSDAELMAAQTRAAELGVDSLQFVVTHTPEKSTRFTAENIEGLPIIWPLAFPVTTPHLYYKRPQARPLGPTHSGLVPNFPGAGKVQLCLDDCRSWSGVLFLRGWAMGIDGRRPSCLKIRYDGVELGRVQLGLLREDVHQAFPTLGNHNAGFIGACQIPTSVKNNTVHLTIEYHTPEGEVFPLDVEYDLSQTDTNIFNASPP